MMQLQLVQCRARLRFFCIWGNNFRNDDRSGLGEYRIQPPSVGDESATFPKSPSYVVLKGQEVFGA